MLLKEIHKHESKTENWLIYWMMMSVLILM